MGCSLKVLWRHTPGESARCVLCSDSHLAFDDLLSAIRPLLENDGIMVTYEEQLLGPPDDPTKAGIFLNGRALEKLLHECDRAQSLCHSTPCEPFFSDVHITRDDAGNRCISAPEILFRKAILASLEDS